MAASIVALSVVVNLLRGSPKNESIIDLPTCSVSSWVIFGTFVFICLLSTVYAVKKL